jgi:hypothetical protein
MARRALIKLGVFALIVAAGAYFVLSPSPQWHQAQALSVALASGIYLAALCPGRLRDVLSAATSVVFCLLAIEIYIGATDVPRTREIRTIPSAAQPILGWGPASPGVFRHTKIEIETGRVVFDVNYTIDGHLHRQVVSAPDAPTVAFAGASDVFGEGLPDEDTLPQQFADATDRRFHVVNLGYRGYGAQQVLRGLETGLFDDVLSQPLLFVIPVTPRQIVRTACLERHMARAPRYEIENGQPIFLGTCKEGWSILVPVMSYVSSSYDWYISRAMQGARLDWIDLFVGILLRVGEIARAKYAAQTLIIYVPDEAYLRSARYTDARLMLRLRDAGVAVVNGGLDPVAYPGQSLEIPGDGHPSAAAERARATIVRNYIDGVPEQRQ